MGLPILEEGHCGSNSHNSGVGCAGVIGAPGLICKVLNHMQLLLELNVILDYF